MKKNYLKSWSAGRIASAVAALLCFGATHLDAQVLIPASGSNSIACGTNTVLMDHAGSGNYSNNVDGYTVLYAGAGGIITIQGTYDTESCCDPIYIYNGVGTGGSVLAQYQGNGGSMSFTTTPGQTITIRFRSDGSVVYSGLSFTVSYSGACVYTPCNGTPASNSVVATSTLICPVFGTATLNLANQYSLSAISYSFQMSTAGALGPYTNIANANGITGSQNAITYVTPTLNATTWYQVALTCTNGGITTSATAIEIQVANTTTNTVPYFEGFEGIVNNKDLPNCSWTRSDAFQCGSRTASVNAWRTPFGGSKFAEFDGSNSVYGQTRYFYSNGILLNAGITYSASVWYNTPGYATWYNIALLYGPNQSPAGLVQLASVQNPNNSSYQPMSNTFSVATTGLYYLAVRGQENYYASQLVWDNLAITAPCQFANNAAAIALTGTTTICAGQPVSITASGASTYTWNTGATTNAITVSPGFNTTYTVTGINPLSGCLGTATRQIVVNQLPPVSILALKTSVCEGESVTMQALSANSYTWSAGPSFNSVLTVTPTTANNTYTVIGANAFGCTASAVQQIQVNPLPVVSVSGTTVICQGVTTNLTANGAGANGSYEWKASTLYLQSPVASVAPNVTTSYSVTGTDGLGCKGTAVVIVAVDACVGIQNINGSSSKVSVYPNPNSGVFTVELANGVNKTIEVVDVTGRVVLSNTTANNTTDVNISTLANGVYYVKVKSENVSEVIKVVKQ